MLWLPWICIILEACPVFGQLKAGILPYIVINKKDDNKSVAFLNAQKAIDRTMCEKEQCLEGQKKKQQVMDKLSSFKFSTKQSVASPVIVTVSKSGSKEMDKTIASFFYENGISFNFADSSSFAHMTKESMRFTKQNPFHSNKAPTSKWLSGKLLDQAYKPDATEQPVAPNLAIAKSLKQLAISEH